MGRKANEGRAMCANAVMQREPLRAAANGQPGRRGARARRPADSEFEVDDARATAPTVTVPDQRTTLTRARTRIAALAPAGAVSEVVVHHSDKR
jgi:hypothetical protein